MPWSGEVIANRASHAVHVLDRFHIMQQMNKKLDRVRAAETRQLKADGYEPILTHSRWCLLKRPENRTTKEMAGTLRRHRGLLLNWFHAKGEISSGSVEGMNTKAKVALRKSYGFKTFEVYETVLYHELARLPEHEIAHRFC